MTEQETLYQIAFTRIPRLNSLHQHKVLEAFGSATAIYENCQDIKQVIPDASDSICKAISKMGDYLTFAEKELEFVKSKNIECIGTNDVNYPTRLMECPDSPILLYHLGNTNLNAPHIVSIVGTRQITEYGKELCRFFIGELKKLCPDVLIVSGLAYGVDIHAHRNALQQGLPTLGVVAHGLDQIYPRMHRDTAIEMIKQGGLLTEYPSGTSIDKINFVARNRIVAGLSDATIIIESAEKGGSLITGGIARDYNRDVFAFPGRITDSSSAGCNRLIANNEAGAILSAEDFIQAMGWKSAKDKEKMRRKDVQLELFPDLSEEERKVVNALKNCDGKPNNQISIETCIPMGQLSGLLFTMEMKGLVKMMSGGMYRLITL